MQIDLNADLGEGAGNDRQLLQQVTSTNIACGFHAGDAQTMLQSVRWALEYGVAIGAHPGFADRENFGRIAMQLPAETVYAQVIYQIGALKTMVESEGGCLLHVKPHGMLYNQSAQDPLLANTIARAVLAVDPSLILVGLSNSESIRAAQALGLRTREEVFADRAYQADGSLVPRTQPGALIENDAQAVAQTLTMICQRRVKSVTGEWVALNADTLCLHGDGARALTFATLLRQTFSQHDIHITSGLRLSNLK